MAGRLLNTSIAARRNAATAIKTGVRSRAVFSTGQPAYSDLFIGSVTRSRIVTISVPVMRGEPGRL